MYSIRHILFLCSVLVLHISFWCEGKGSKDRAPLPFLNVFKKSMIVKESVYNQTSTVKGDDAPIFENEFINKSAVNSTPHVLNVVTNDKTNSMPQDLKGNLRSNLSESSSSPQIALAGSNNISISKAQVEKRERKRMPRRADTDDVDTKEIDDRNTADVGVSKTIETFRSVGVEDVDFDCGSPYMSSGYWNTIDRITSLGMSSNYDSMRISRQTRLLRKLAANLTGLHGLISHKGRMLQNSSHVDILIGLNCSHDEESSRLEDEISPLSGRLSINNQTNASQALERGTRARRLAQTLFRRHSKAPSVNFLMTEESIHHDSFSSRENSNRPTMPDDIDELQTRIDRVKDIDTLISKIQKKIAALQCEKDDLQSRPNPLFNYTSITNQTRASVTDGASDNHGAPTLPTPQLSNISAISTFPERTSRVFSFPPNNFAAEYIDELVASGRLVLLNHTQLWQASPGAEDESDDEEIKDDIFSGADFADIYQSTGSKISVSKKKKSEFRDEKRNRNGRATSGSWLLRQSLGRGLRLGEKIGETIEMATYKAICASIMSILARSVSALHGVNVMSHSDIRLYMETDIAPSSKNSLPDGDKYAEEEIVKAIRRSAKKKKRRSRYQGSRSHGNHVDESLFLQRDAVVETLISHCQISAPLLKLFPISWQRALLGNIIALVAAVVSDFADGMKIQILGHQLSLSFKPITASDVKQQLGSSDFRYNKRRSHQERFEEAVRATAEDVSKSLEFLDRWHERALGGRMLRAQIGNLIARIVLTLTDEVLSGAKFDLWSAQVGGPRIVAGLEFRQEVKT